MVRVTVAIPGRSYEVTIGSGLIAAARDHLPELPGAEHAFVVSDRTVADSWFEPLARSLRETGLSTVLLGVPEGEEAKSLQVFGTLVRQLGTQEAHRDDVLLALGGGAVGDLAGFVAATYMRGMPLVQVPTTLTAQVDAAIGGKTGVNLPEGKNLVGAFSQPRAVLADVTALASLPERDLRSGLAEVAKYGLALDPSILDVLETGLPDVWERDPAVLEELVARCVRCKAQTVSEDERDTGRRLVLNYGHTLGHALERLDAFAGLSHGEAIAVGMLFAARLAESTGTAEPGLVSTHARVLASIGLEPDGHLPDVDRVIAAMRLDKKYRGGVRFVLLEAVGRPVVVEQISEDQIRTVLKEMGAQG